MASIDAPFEQPADRGQHAVGVAEQVFRAGNWDVTEPTLRERRPDFLARKGNVSYVVEVKSAPEGRADRLIPLWSQACLQVLRIGANEKGLPLAIVAAPNIRPVVADQILAFARENAPDVAAGVIDFAGLRRFAGLGLEELNGASADASLSLPIVHDPADLFSDLNQWMLKVLLAPELPDALLGAPRGEYRNASQLAEAAGVSKMSAFRFVRQLQIAGYLHESSSHLRVVRRRDLFRRWQALGLRPAREIPMKFLLGKGDKEIRRMLESGRACLALFAAVDALGLGFVHGIPPHIYVPRLGASSLAAWKRLVPAQPGDAPDVLLRQAPSPKSVFRAIVRPKGLACTDVIQAWLDVSGHPARGPEQADVIRRRIIEPRLLKNAEHE